MARATPATYWRRRLVALGSVALVLLLAFNAIEGDDGLTVSPQQVREAALRAHPIELTIEASGDLLIHTAVWTRAQALDGGAGYDFAPLFAEIRPYVDGADLALCHMETPMTPAPPTSYPIFNTPPALAEGVAETGWDLCDTASNHSLDQGQEGIDETGKAFDRAGIGHTGSFPSPAAQRRLTLVDVGGVRIAFLAYTTDTNGIPLPNRWSVNIATAGRILEDARRAVRSGADAVIVNVHWGGEIVAEYQTEPSAGQLALARKLTASRDITAVVGQGPHAVQPIQRINGKYVVFSEGNLVSNQSPAAGLPASSQDGLVALLHLVLDERGARVTAVRYLPVWVRQPDYTVLPVGSALRKGEYDAATLQDSYERTVGVAGRGPGITPIPPQLPNG
jgi:poly-gamma-glutamate capsule biosynthesis protein CapA/YwtB (metallophosphatase superfamily)